MLVLKTVSGLGVAFATFVLGISIVSGLHSLTTGTVTSNETSNVSQIQQDSPPMTAVDFVKLAPESSNNCFEQQGEIYPFGWEYYLQTSQIPRIKRVGHDGRWFFFETEAENGRSFEFFGIVPDSVGRNNERIAIIGKLVRLSNGDITGNVDATYYPPQCILK